MYKLIKFYFFWYNKFMENWIGVELDILLRYRLRFIFFKWLHGQMNIVSHLWVP